MNAIKAMILSTAIMTVFTSSFALTFTINEKTTYQRIHGFGGMEYYSSATEINDIVTELGANTIRFELSGLNPAETGGKQSDMALLRGLKNGGVKYFIGSNWNAPAQFKDATDHIIPAQYGALADWVVTRVKNFKDSVGVDPYAIGLQNEADLGPSIYYDACFYTAVDFREIIKLLGPKLRTAGYSTKIIWSEGMITNSGYNRGCMETVMKDSIASKYVMAYAVHGYGQDGMTPASPDALLWKSLGNLAATNKIPLWMTETSGYGDANTWTSVMKFAKWLYVTLKYGRLSLHTYHYLSYSGTNGGYFINGGVKGLTYYAYKQFVKFIPEGSIQLQCTASDTAIPAPAVFADTAANTIALVFVNDGAARTFDLAGTGLPASFTQYLTTATDKCANKGSVQNNTAITLPANSVMTLVGTGYNQQIVSVNRAITPHVVKPAVAGAPSIRNAYSITGRKLGSHGLAQGIYLKAGNSMDVKIAR